MARPAYTTSTFWINTGERVIRTAAQTALAAFVTDHTVHDIDVKGGLALTGMAALASLLTALAAKTVGDGESPSFLLPAPRTPLDDGGGPSKGDAYLRTITDRDTGSGQ